MVSFFASTNVRVRSFVTNAIGALVTNVGIAAGDGTAEISVTVKSVFAPAAVSIRLFEHQTFGVQMAIVGDVAREFSRRRRH